ncbi:MAG: LamG domain-containing protein [Planctomycetota bacterium]
MIDLSRSKRRQAVCLLSTVFVFSCYPSANVAQEPSDPGLIFHASFDKRDVTADYAQGNPRSTTLKESRQLRVVRGISGAGLQLEHEQRLDYEMNGNFDIRRGSVSLWIQPVNWHGNDGRFHHHFVAQCPKIFNFYLYQYTKPTHLVFYLAVGERRVTARTPTDQWRPGKWYKIDATWDQKSMRLYVNSELESEALIPDDLRLPDCDKGLLSVTPVQFWATDFSSPDDRTVVDEVKIYNRVRPPEEIRRDYVSLAGEDPDVAAKLVDMVYEIDSHAHVARVKLDAFRLDRISGKALTAAVHLEDSDGRALAKQTMVLEDARGAFELQLNKLAPGTYKLQATVASQDGQHRESVETEFDRPETPWLQPMPQYDHVVPDPWSPIEGDKRLVRVWGRSYEFEEGPLPKAIISQDVSLLAAPIQLRIDTGSGAQVPVWRGSKLAERHADKVVRTGIGRAGELSISYRTTVEFDGMLRCDLELTPDAGKAKVDAVRLDVPLANGAADYLLTHKLIPWEGSSMDLDFRELLWLTGHRVGLCWFAESEANWVYPSGTKPIRLNRQDDATTLTVRMIASPVAIDKPLTYTFGIQATPLRPLPENWRNFNLGGHGKIRGAKAQITAWGGGSLKQFGYLEPWRDDVMHRVCKKYRNMGSSSLPYSTPTYLSDHNPIFDFYRLEWHNSSGHKYVGYKHRDGFEYSMVATCAASDYSNLMAYWVENLSRDFDIGGIYFDLSSPDRCANARHGCGGTDAFGKRYHTYPIFGLREVLKKTFTILHSRGKLLINHAHSRFYPPCHAFSDYWFPGEQYAAALGRNLWHYCDNVPLEVWQVELSPKPKGVGVCFLPQYGRGTDQKYRDETPAPSRSLLACCLVHDIPVSASWINLHELQRVWDLYEKFQLSNATFLPYWESSFVEIDEPLLASGFKIPNAIVIMLANLTPVLRKGTLCLDAIALGIGEKHVLKDEQTGEVLDQRLDSIPVWVPARDFTILSVTW